MKLANHDSIAASKDSGVLSEDVPQDYKTANILDLIGRTLKNNQNQSRIYEEYCKQQFNLARKENFGKIQIFEKKALKILRKTKIRGQISEDMLQGQNRLLHFNEQKVNRLNQVIHFQQAVAQRFAEVVDRSNKVSNPF